MRPRRHATSRSAIVAELFLQENEIGTSAHVGGVSAVVTSSEPAKAPAIETVLMAFPPLHRARFLTWTPCASANACHHVCGRLARISHASLSWLSGLETDSM